jgi:hypothetical protein
MGFGGLCTDMALVVQMMDRVLVNTSNISLLPPRFGVSLAAASIQWGNVDFVDQFLTRAIRIPICTQKWHTLLDYVLCYAMCGGFLHCIVPTAMMLARHRKFNGIYHVFQGIDSCFRGDSIDHETDVIVMSPEERAAVRRAALDVVFATLCQDCSEPGLVATNRVGGLMTGKESMQDLLCHIASMTEETDELS